MSYFADLTRYEYDPTDLDVLNIGWLDGEHPYKRGETPADFRAALQQLVQRPIMKHRGFHVCEICRPEDAATFPFPTIGNGQIRVRSQQGTWYAAPRMISHYVEEHSYQPPDEFVEAVRNPGEVGSDHAL
jgi:hypothetical protein